VKLGIEGRGIEKLKEWGIALRLRDLFGEVIEAEDICFSVEETKVD